MGFVCVCVVYGKQRQKVENAERRIGESEKGSADSRMSHL